MQLPLYAALSKPPNKKVRNRTGTAVPAKHKADEPALTQRQESMAAGILRTTFDPSAAATSGDTSIAPQTDEAFARLCRHNRLTEYQCYRRVISDQRDGRIVSDPEKSIR